MSRARTTFFALTAAASALLPLGGTAWAQDPPPTAQPPDPEPLQELRDQMAALRAELAAEAARNAAQERELERRRSELDELQATTEILTDAEQPAAHAEDGSTFRVYGFVDMGLQKAWTRDDPEIPTTKSTFVLGNINLYFDFRPAEAWSSLVEVRFTNYPNGEDQFGIPEVGREYERQDTSVSDPGNGIGYDHVRWGGIVLERAYIQWQKHEALGVRVGQFLTPYGIWNVDHGTPTLISMWRPKFVSNELWPSRQLGVQVFGRLLDRLPAPWELGYHAYVSNGRTQGSVDLTEDKMVGGRLVASRTRPYPMQLGLSAMWGGYSEQEHHLSITTGEVTRPEIIAFDESGIAADASIDIGALRLRGELATRHLHYQPGKRRPAWLPGSYEASRTEWDVYLLGAYRILGTRFEPYGYAEVYYWPTILGTTLAAASAGVNVYFTPAIQLKLQYLQERWLGPREVEQQKIIQFAGAKLVMGL